MIIEKKRQICIKDSLLWYEGTLDFLCDFCNSNSYKNYHLLRNDNLKFVVCEDCLKKAKEVIK
jgi:hypothetical protein